MKKLKQQINELVSHFKFREKQIRKAYNEVTKLCEE